MEKLGHHWSQERLSRSGGSDEEDIGLGQLDIGEIGLLARLKLNPTIMIIDRDRENPLGPLLSDDIFVQDRLDLAGLGSARSA